MPTCYSKAAREINEILDNLTWEPTALEVTDSIRPRLSLQEEELEEKCLYFGILQILNFKELNDPEASFNFS